MNNLLKCLTVIAIVLFISTAATAQRGHGIVRTRVIVASPYVGFGYSPFYYSPFGYYPFGYPYYSNGMRRESKLEMQVDDIKADYRDKIHSARKDKSISREERRKIVQQLKTERDKTVDDLKRNYYKRKPSSSTTPADKG